MNNTTSTLLDTGVMANMTNMTDTLVDSVADLISGSLNMTDDNNMTTMMMSTSAPDPTPNPRPQRYLLTNTYVFTKIYTYVAYVTGIPGNFLTILILARMRPINSVQIWLLGLSCIDFISLTVRCCITPFQNAKIMGYSDGLCWFEHMITLTCEYSNYLFFLSMTIERFIAVWFPLKMAFWTSPKRATIGLFGMLLIIFPIQFHHIWSMYSTSRGCYFKKDARDFWENTWQNKVEAILIRAVTLGAVLTLNILILIKLTFSRGIQNAMSEGQIKEKQKQQRQINRLLTAATVFFLVSVMPDTVYRFIYLHVGDPYNNWVHLRNILIILNVFTVLKVGNHAGNFFCYILVARKFRNELIHMLTCGRYGEHNGVKGSLVNDKLGGKK